ncbi:hypothetical protein Pta02_04500 [Planobispora takensis]|uniref:Uncharacterized protein n=1 Tax=Planobispora takensis TaxID=1367882 RepID=A0A8J3SPZ8_9ACTN|nr:hypothetical protein Pta02_04500 [Planobispora takensis]
MLVQHLWTSRWEKHRRCRYAPTCDRQSRPFTGPCIRSAQSVRGSLSGEICRSSREPDGETTVTVAVAPSSGGAAEAVAPAPRTGPVRDR